MSLVFQRRQFLLRSAALAAPTAAALWLPAGLASAAGVAKSNARVEAVQNIATAHRLVRYGDKNKDPLSMIVAARMLKEAGSRPAECRRDDPVPATPAAAMEADRFLLEAVLARAKSYATGRADIVALIEDVEAMSSRGSVAGPGRWRELLRTNATNSYRISFKAGEPAIVLVSGDGDSDIDLFVLDEQGKEVCRDDRDSDDMVCRWVPSKSGDYVVKIKNQGMANHYVAAHN